MQVPWWKQTIGIFIIAVGVFQAYCSGERWVAIHECNTTIIATQNTSSQAYDSYYKFTATLYGLFAILHALATRQIFIDTSVMYTRRECCNAQLCTEIKDSLVQLCTEINLLKLKCCFFLAFLVIVLLFILSGALIVTGLLYDLAKDDCNFTWRDKIFIIFYHVMILIITVVINFVLLYLAIATVHVCFIWKQKDVFEHELKPEEYNCEDYVELNKKASLFLTKICSDYRDKGKKVIKHTSTFQSWFVLQWFTYFLGIFIDLTYVLRPWILGGDEGIKLYKQHKLEYAYISVFAAYDIIVFIVPFAFGLMMSNSHDRYYRQLVQESDNVLDFLNKPGEQKTEEEKEKNCALGYALITTVLKVQKVQEYDFTPSILGVNIPLNNPGYILSIVIAMVTLILGILVNPLD